ncbi:MAG: prepilin peptidase [Burkholderiaceae bacterium]|nr:prepilin peptidase [Burkholderiaceae bacterium]
MNFDYQIFLTPWALGVLGLCVGSFLNVVIYRLPVMMERQWVTDACSHLSDEQALSRTGQLSTQEALELSRRAHALGSKVEALPALNLAAPRSRCPHCGHVLAWHENLPVLGWLRLLGRCASCKAPISMRYPLVELATGLMFLTLGQHFGAHPTTLLWCGFVAALLTLAGIDWDTTLLPDSINQPLLWAGLAAASLGWTIPLQNALTGVFVGYLSLWTVYWVFKLATGKEGMGYGDFKLLAALGAWLGWQMILPIVLAASLIGAVIGIAMKLNSQLREGRYVPFGPFLAGAGLVVLFAGQGRVLAWLGWA